MSADAEKRAVEVAVLAVLTVLWKDTALIFLVWPESLARTLPDSRWVRITFLSVLPVRTTSAGVASDPALTAAERLPVVGASACTAAKWLCTARQVTAVLASALCEVWVACTLRLLMASFVALTVAPLRALRPADSSAQVATSSCTTLSSSWPTASLSLGSSTVSIALSSTFC